MSTEDLTPERLAGVEVAPSDRSAFIARTYMHVFGAIAAFCGLEYLFFTTGIAEQVFMIVMQTSWLAVLGGFVLVSWIASHVAHRVESVAAQYAALGGFVLAEALIFVPLLYIAYAVAPEIIELAAGVTLLAFAALTAIAMLSGRDFSIPAHLFDVGRCHRARHDRNGASCSVVLSSGLRTYFSMAMIAFAGASILYDTSKILRTLSGRQAHRGCAGAVLLLSP